MVYITTWIPTVIVYPESTWDNTVGSPAMAEVVESERVEIMLSSYSEHESDTDVITRGVKRSRSRLSSSENRYV